MKPILEDKERGQYLYLVRGRLYRITQDAPHRTLIIDDCDSTARLYFMDYSKQMIAQGGMTSEAKREAVNKAVLEEARDVLRRLEE